MKRALTAAGLTFLMMFAALLPAHAQPPPDPTGGCEAWLVSASKSGTTISATFKMACESWKSGDWAISGIIQRSGGSTKERTGHCYSSTSHLVASCTVTVTYTGDPSGSQKYTIGIAGTVSETHIGIPNFYLWCEDGVNCNPRSHTYTF